MKNSEDKTKKNIFVLVVLGLICFAIGFVCAIMYNTYIRDNGDTKVENEKKTTSSVIINKDSKLITALDNYLNKYVKRKIIKNVHINLSKEMDKSEYCNSSISNYGSKYEKQIQRGAVITYDLVTGNEYVGIDYVISGNDEIIGDHIEASAVFVFEEVGDSYKVINLWTECGEE